MKRFKLKKKTFKGMTLIEIIISLAILTVMTSVLVIASKAINSYMRSANDVNGRVADQAPVAEAAYVNAASPTIEGGVDIVVKYNGGDINLHGNAYEAYDADEVQEHTNEFGRGLNMKFITGIENVTEAPTAAATATPII